MQSVSSISPGVGSGRTGSPFTLQQPEFRQFDCPPALAKALVGIPAGQRCPGGGEGARALEPEGLFRACFRDGLLGPTQQRFRRIRSLNIGNCEDYCSSEDDNASRRHGIGGV